MSYEIHIVKNLHELTIPFIFTISYDSVISLFCQWRLRVMSLKNVLFCTIKKGRLFSQKRDGPFWLRNTDSNRDKQIQRLSCYPYTIPQCCRYNAYIIPFFQGLSIDFPKVLRLFIPRNKRKGPETDCLRAREMGKSLFQVVLFVGLDHLFRCVTRTTF